MKKRIFQVLNFFAFNLLFFALYLNFVHKDKESIQTVSARQTTASVNRTVLVKNQNEYIQQATQNNAQAAAVTGK